MRIYGYLRASTKEQDATRAKTTLESFVEGTEQKIAAWFVDDLLPFSVPEEIRVLHS
jgi:DNA invertase Pin-like site-specific DNA recombinase